MAELRYQNELTKLELDEQSKRDQALQQAEKARFDRERQLNEQRQAFIMSRIEYDTQTLNDSLERDLRLLEIRYAKEIMLNKHTQEEITELNRRQGIEREQIQNDFIDRQTQQLKEMGRQLAVAGIESAYSSIVAGGEFEKGIGQAIFAIGQQASVQAIFQGAKALAFLAEGNVASAAIAGKSAASFAGVATIAGITANKLGAGGGSSGNKTTANDSSPTGLTQTNTTPQREQAESREIVYNINFGGAVIYDTQTAAEQAFADRLTNLQNRTRRGAPRRRGA